MHVDEVGGEQARHRGEIVAGLLRRIAAPLAWSSFVLAAISIGRGPGIHRVR
jgi:hypothetical protein